MPDEVIPTVTNTTVTNTPAPASTETAGVPVSTPVVPATSAAAPGAIAAPLGIADASKAFLASLTNEQKVAPLADPVTPGDEGDTGEVSLEFEAPTFDEATGQWRNKDGTFAQAPSTDPAAVADPNTAANTEAPPAEAATPAIVVPLKARDGSVKEIEVSDPEVADMLRANANDGMRRDEFNRRIESVQQREAEQREFETVLRTNPEYVFSTLPQAAQERLAESIIATHWDAIIDRISRMDQDPTYRVTVAAEARVRQTELTAATQEAIATQRYAGQLETACRALIPESVDQATADRFMADASNDLAQILPTRRVQPSELAEVLAPRIALYRFNESAKADQTASDASSTTASVAPPVIRAAMRAPASAASPAVPSTPTNAGVAVPRTVMTDGQRIQQAQTGRAIAAAVAPAGAGAAPVKVSVPVHATVEEASKYVRSQLGNRWA